jgi:hypothetical protein
MLLKSPLMKAPPWITITAGCFSVSFGTKALHLKGVLPPTPYCSIAVLEQPPLVGAALKVGNKVNVVTTAMITKAIRLRHTNLFFMDFDLLFFYSPYPRFWWMKLIF